MTDRGAAVRVFLGGLLFVIALCAWTAARAESAGERLYNGKCRTCHGTEGRGAKAPSLVPFDWSYEEALDLVRHPVCDMPPMPPSVVSDAEVAQIVAYLKTVKEGARDTSP